MSDYEWLSTINKLNLENKTILIIGAGAMAKEFSFALSEMNIQNVTILSRGKKRTLDLCKEYNFTPLFGGYEKHLLDLEQADLVVIATPVESLISATKLALEAGQTNILVEKPVSLYSTQIKQLMSFISHQTVRVGYNRVVYPNFQKLKGLFDVNGVTSCRYSFTEWIHQIDFTKFSTEVLHRWGIANSIHVISMAHQLIGLPKKIDCHRFGEFDWHPSGAVFSGIGLTDKDIPFTYHSDWKAPGRWWIELMTEAYTYRLMPLEKLFRCPINSVTWEEVNFNVTYPNVKLGVAEEIAIMLDDSSTKKPDLIDLEKAYQYCKLSERIFGYMN